MNLATFELINLGVTAAPILVAIARWCSKTLPTIAVFLAVALGLRPSMRRQAAAVLCAMTLAWLAAKGLKFWIPMPRPFEAGVGTLWTAHAATAGFPSVHATVAAAWAVTLWQVLPSGRWRSAAMPLAVAIALAIAWSRIALGVHFLWMLLPAC